MCKNPFTDNTIIQHVEECGLKNEFNFDKNEYQNKLEDTKSKFFKSVEDKAEKLLLTLRKCHNINYNKN